MRLLLMLFALLIAAPAAAAEPEWLAAREYDVLMQPYRYEPPTIRLEAGRPVRLHFLNQGQTTFSFSARDFFRAAQIRVGDDRFVTNGHIRLAPGERRTIALVPMAGRYSAHSGNYLHRLLGMSARIVVE
ncbi:MAG: cupredoxin domain-containing protein [Allosphingosinicella sp.]